MISRTSAEPRSFSESALRGFHAQRTVPSVRTSVTSSARARVSPMDRAEFVSAFLVKKNPREAKISFTMRQFDVEESFKSSPALAKQDLDPSNDRVT